MDNITLEDINLIQESKTFEFLSNDGADSTNIAGSIKNFTSQSSNILKGEAWEKVRTKYTKYDEALSKHSTIANDISSAIQSTITELQSAMNGYESIDLSKLNAIKEQKNACEDKIDNIRSMMNQKRFNFKTFTFEPVYDNAQLQANLDAELKVLEELTKLIMTMEMIKDICDKAEARLNELLAEMTTMATQIEEITPSVAVAV